jgi:hypothetical protein
MSLPAVARLANLYTKATDPKRWRNRGYWLFHGLPFRLGMTDFGFGCYVAYKPDRYSEKYQEYLKRTGRDIISGREKFFRNNRKNNGGDLTRYYFLNLVIDQIHKDGIQGDFAELGVFKGNTAFLLAEAATRSGTTAYLFDTYEGFSQDDLKGIDKSRAVMFTDTSLEAVKSLVGDRNVEYVKGYFPDSTALVPDDRSFCLVHLDCDLYAPFSAALHYFYDRLVPGGFLIMHDYSSLWWEGVEKAVDEFFADKPEKVVPIPDKSGTAVVRKI